MRIFYVVCFQDSRVQKCLDAIRFLCNPYEKTIAHITVRGPYERTSKKADELDKKIQGSRITVQGIDHFWGDHQNTVFLRCASDGLKQAWKKTDYGYNPHITLYDGDSREFASALVKKLSALDLTFSCLANGLKKLVSSKGQQSLELSMFFDSSFVSSLLGEMITSQNIPQLNSETRLRYVEKLFQHLKEFDLEMEHSVGDTSDVENRARKHT